MVRLCGRYFTPKKDGAWTALWFYVVPLGEHSTRVVNHAVIVQKLPAVVKKLAAARPRWIDHLLLNEIFDGVHQAFFVPKGAAKVRGE